MTIETIGEPSGFLAAIYAMRNPMNSWALSDSELIVNHIENDDAVLETEVIGEKDKALSIKLQNAGPEHCKHLRMIYVWVEITAPRYWWTEADTYRFGVDKVSCSTMHKLMARPLTEDDFEHDGINKEYLSFMLDSINGSIEAYKLCKDEDHKKEIWRGIIQALPQSYLQKRTVCMSYAALRNIVRQRAGHKLIEWEYFINWAKSLPESWMIFE